jgi:CRISPR type I-D-associated protein Csc1
VRGLTLNNQKFQKLNNFNKEQKNHGSQEIVKIGNVYLLIFSAHDFLFFVNADYNTNTFMRRYIVNYALNYALNPEIAKIHRNFSGINPHYDDDFKKIVRVASPALPLITFEKFKTKHYLSLKRLMKFSIVNKILEIQKFQYNAVGESLLFQMEPASYNWPNFGTQERLVPLSLFYCIVFGNPGPNIFRLGKKSCICRGKYFKINNINVKNGKFSLDHAIEAPLHENYEMKELTMERSRPIPIILSGEFNGEYLKGKISDLDIDINIVPYDKNKYPNINIENQF